MRAVLIIVFFMFTFGCATNKKVLEPKIIAYSLPYQVDKLLQNEIKKNPKKNYCIILSREGDFITNFSLVNKYSYFHKHTNYRVLIGNQFYPVSFMSFDIRFGVTEDAEVFLKNTIENKDKSKSIGKRRYPMYHGYYFVKYNHLKNIVIFNDYVY